MSKLTFLLFLKKGNVSYQKILTELEICVPSPSYQIFKNRNTHTHITRVNLNLKKFLNFSTEKIFECLTMQCSYYVALFFKPLNLLSFVTRMIEAKIAWQIYSKQLYTFDDRSLRHHQLLKLI